MTVGEGIIQRREKRGFTQNRLAEWAGVSQTHLRRVELGEADITVGHLSLICDALDISLKEFFSNPDEETDCSASMSRLSDNQKKYLLDFLNSL